MPDRHPYELYLGIEDIEHSPTTTKSPQTNGICERFHQTLLNECYLVAFRKRLYASREALQTDLDHFLAKYNAERPHQGRWCYGKTPMQNLPRQSGAGEGETDCLAREHAGLNEPGRRAQRAGMTVR